MVELAKVFVSGVLILASLLLYQGFGQSLGVLQESQQFNFQQPSIGSCDWKENGTFQNVINTSGECNLELDSASTNTFQVNLSRFEASTNQEFNDSGQTITRIDFESHSEYGDYLTQDGSNQDGLYVTQPFYLQQGNTEIWYEYQSLSSSNDYTLELVRESDGTTVYTHTLQPGNSTEDFLEKTNYSVANAGTYTVEVQLPDGAFDEKRLYSLELFQRSNETQTTSVGTGKYISNVFKESDQTAISELTATANSISGNQEPFQKAYIDVYGIRNDQEVVTKSFDLSNGFSSFSDVIEADVVDSFYYEISLVSESGTSPQVESVEVTGSTANTVANPSVQGLLQTVLVIVLIGVALLYLASGLSG